MLRNLPRVRAAAGALGAVVGYGCGLLAEHRAETKASSAERHSIVVIGGGAAGLSVASQLLLKLGTTADVAIVEPSEWHYYQPGWTLVGGGIMKAEETRKKMSSFMPKGATWIKAAVSAIDPDQNSLSLADGRQVGYDFLVVAPGLQIDFCCVKGLKEAVGHDGVSSIYDYEHCQATWEDVRAFKGGTAVFTQPKSGIKCGGAPQKIMWLAEDYWSRAAVRKDVTVKFCTGLGSMFAVPKYREALERLVRERGVDASFGHELVEVDGARKVATFEKADGSRVSLEYDLLHVVPRMGAPAFIKASPLACKATGFVEVDKQSLQHVAYPNVFACGDVASTPNSKTAAAVTAQAPVVVHNLIRQMEGKRGKAQYDGYASCPILTRRGELLLAEFKYGGVLAETFHAPPLLDQGKPQALFYYMKTIVFPFAYWNFMLHGRWFGTRTFFEPRYTE